MGIFSDDIVQDILARVVRAAQGGGGFNDAMAEQIERQVRADWGGERHYVAQDAESRRIARNDKIIADWENGTRDVQRLAQRYGLTPRQIRNIVR